MTPAIFKRLSSTDRPDRPFSFDLLDQKGYDRSANNLGVEDADSARFSSPRMLICKLQEQTGAREFLVKNNEILRNK